MVTKVRTIDFLPEVFRTDTNAQFLAATLDQLVQQPDLQRVEGFIGQKYGYSIEPNDRYVVEPSQVRSDYQLDPSVVFLKTDTQTAQDFINYPGILNALHNNGAITENNNRLFENEYYSWDSFADLDKIVNYSQYYWLPYGPDAVTVSTNTIYLSDNYVASYSELGYNINDSVQKNPSITLLRGGTYTFEIDQISSFWIQGVPGISGYGTSSNISTRDVLGVTNNGITSGTITFTVPAKDAQQEYDYPGNNTVDLVSTASFDDINGQTSASIGNIDGVTQLDGKTLMFYNNSLSSSQIYFYSISVNSLTDIVTLTEDVGIINSEKITATSGTTYVGRTFYRDVEGVIQLIPYLSAILDTLYYQDGTDALAFGVINLVESNETNTINIDQILGKENYTSPNGVTFINGLKVIFDSLTVPSTYQNNEYYVEGVGTAINLLLVNNFVSVESDDPGTYYPYGYYNWDMTEWDQSTDVPLYPDYITINRNSRDLNAWSRSNRWFNQQVLDATIDYNGQLTVLEGNTSTRAQRPIIEFYGNLGLYDSGTKSLGTVTLFDNSTTDAFVNVAGQSSYTVDGQLLSLGQTVIFNADTNESVRQKIYEVSFVPIGVDDAYVIALSPVATANDNEQVVILSGTTYQSTTWRYSTTDVDWIQCQQKSSVNQAPLFDIYDINDISISNDSSYPGSTFTGTKLFSYTEGTGSNDSVLGFPISYSSASSIGDINFTVNLNSDTFSYQVNGTVVEENINIGFVYEYVTADIPTKKTGWVTAYSDSFQSQVFQFDVTESTQSSFECDVLVKVNSIIDPHHVYVNDVSLDDDTEYSYALDSVNNTTTINLVTPAIKGDKVTVTLLSDQVSKTAYYEIPSNLQNNPFNTNITSVNVGDIKNQYDSIFENTYGVTGVVFGSNNVYNLGNLNQNGTAIIQNSASMVLPGLFLRKPGFNLFEALQYNSEQYINFKSLLVNLTTQNDFTISTTPAAMLNTVLYQISSTKNDTNPFFWSDMIFSGSPYITNSYPVGVSISTLTLPTYRTYDFTSANYYGLGVYITTTIDNQSVTTQLIRGVDYTVSDISPQLTITYEITTGDVVTVNEYNQTYGTYCPNTPTKLGLYQSFVPGVILDDTYTTETYFILGHDGSYTALYGDYVNGQLSDFRDQVLLEFETRVYNNLKVSGDIPLPADEVIPGQFRTTDYSQSEILEIYRTNFLKWVGSNRIDYKTQVYTQSNKFTYNYNQSTDILDKQLLQQGYWRGIYNWFYDTSNPANAPWEMLGLTSEPSWWTDRYGESPYTSDNTYMWQDIADGYVWNDGDSYYNPYKVRPELLSVLPVNSAGTLKNPFNTVVANYNSLTFNRSWVVGDQGPAETSYLRSSSYPFDLMRILALTKPAKFFNLNVDRDLYKYNTDLNQYLYNDRYHLDPKEVVVYGDGVSKASYINWIVDYINQRGVDGTTEVTTALQNLDVRLTYNLAGFSAKNYLKFLIEKSTPTTQNTTLLIPDNSYSVLLYDNVPEDKIVYSSVIVQKSSTGYTVWGNSQSDPYFTISIPKVGYYETITVGDASVKVANQFYDTLTTSIPYGNLFYSEQAVSDFIKSYGEYLTKQGMVFGYVIDTITYNWNQMIREFLNWAEQDWEVGSIVSLNPSAKIATVDRSGLIVQPLTIQQENFILNQNLIPLQNQNASIIRENESFTIKVLTDGDTVALTNLNLASMEHAVVFDNYTIFNDTIYDLVTGLRQQRLLLQGYKSGEWNGYVNASGFIINEDNIEEWSANTKYASGKIVSYKNLYWVANQLIQPQSEFVNEQWTQTSYDNIKTGLLPNPSTNAYESLYYYDSTKANFENDADLLAFSLIGYRPRQYLADADLSDISQVGIYKNIIKEKGTNLIANAFKSANLVQGKIDYNVKENWAIRTSTFGSVSNSNFVECLLLEDELTGNPTIIGFSENLDVEDAQQTVLISNLINWNTEPSSASFLPSYQYSYSEDRGLPSAGYVNLNDVKFKAFELTDLNNSSLNVDRLYRGNNIWVAKYRGSWDVFTPETVDTQVISIVNNLNGTITVNFAANPNLSKYDPLVIINFDTRINGYYEVKSVSSLTSVVVTKSIDNSILNIVNIGVAFKLVSRRFDQSSDQVGSTVFNSEYYNKKSWIDSDSTDQWTVWACAPEYYGMAINPSSLELEDFGTSVAYSTEIGYVGTSPANGTIYRYYVDADSAEVTTQKITVSDSTFGTSAQAIDNYLYISDTVNNTISVYSNSTIGDNVGIVTTVTETTTGEFTVSADRQWLYIANTTLNTVAIWSLNSDNDYDYVDTIEGPETSSGFGTSLSTSIDGVKLIVGAPYENLTTSSTTELVESGAAYVYSRGLRRYMADGLTTTYHVYENIPNSIAYVYIDDVLTTAVTINSAGTFTFDSAPSNGSIIEISYGQMTLMTQLLSKNPIVGGNFGISVATNKYGAQILVGCPYELNSVYNTPNVQGAVYRWTNGAQQYGTILGTITNSKTGYIYIDGFRVQYSGTATDIATSINEQTPTNIIATASDTLLQISVINDTVETINNIIDITGPINNIIDLGFELYTSTQVIVSPNLPTSGIFGSNISMGNRDNLIISDPEATALAETTFDYPVTDSTVCATTDDLTNISDNFTIFDNGATVIIDPFVETGVVYEYDYLPAADESINNPAKYVFGQYIQSVDTDGMSTSPKFGSSIVNNDGVFVVGAPNWFESGLGQIFAFTNICTDSSWYIDKVPLDMVAVEQLNNISIYDTVTNKTLDYLDYIDPDQGKLLGAVETNLDYISSTDPATYADGVVWTYEHVGDTWLDTTSLRMLNYNQPDITYNAKNWGKAFPGSTADIYTWVRSSFPPIQYSGSGYVIDYDKFTTTRKLDKSTNSIVVDYYFWVKNYNLITEGKTLSALTLSQYLLNPINSGISFLGAISTNVVALFNCRSSINAASSALHIGYKVDNTPDQKHESWTLIQEDTANDFLSGVPDDVNSDPTGIYLKYLDSFAGQNRQGVYIPNVKLPILTRYGIDYAQSMFINRAVALQNYITYANEVLIQYPIAEIRNLYLLSKSGVGYDTTDYWEYTDWWATGYSSSTKIVLEVNTVTDLQTLQLSQIIQGTESIVVGLKDGLIVKVKSNAQGNSEVWNWNEDIGWERIGLENGTIQILDSLYTTDVNWDIAAFDVESYDFTLYQETYWIIRWLNEQVYINDLLIERNNSLILMFNYIQSESLQQHNYLPWLNKTSLIDVSHTVRELLPYKKFQRDNQEFLSGYLNEVKPFHVKIKDFLFVYPGQDEFLGDITDFDLPAQYVVNNAQFETPQLVYSSPKLNSPEYLPTNSIWSQPEYSQWFENYGLSINNEQGLYTLTQLSEYITAYDVEIPVKNTTVMPESGTIYIGVEQISYGSVDRILNVLTNVIRGIDSTAIAHLPNANVKSILPAVIVLDKARGYSNPPSITVSIDTTIYPEPRIAAVLTSILVDEQLSEIIVTTEGSGYAVQPVITIESSNISFTFTSSDINYVFNTITIVGHTFETGDPVKYTVGTDTIAPDGLTANSYYYVRVVDVNTIALYYSLNNAVNYNKSTLHDVERVSLQSQGSGSDNILAVTARASILTSSQPIREMITTVKFDRISYGTSITEWVSGGIYAGEFTDIGKLSSSTLLTASSSPMDYLSWNGTSWDADLLASAQGATLPIVEIYSPIIVTNAVSVQLNYGYTTVQPGQLNGQQITAYTVSTTEWTNAQTYYVKVTTETLVELYYDPLLKFPVLYDDFNYSIDDALFLAEPFIFTQSMVTYSGKLYRCIISNNDSTFNYNNWEQILSDNSILNAADRIAAFYEPTSNMSGRDLRQLMSGVVYPNDTILGTPFNYYDGLYGSNATIDADVQSPTFNWNQLTNPTVYDVQGGEFSYGYGPEELVPGLITDFLQFNVTTNPDTLDPGTYLNFRIQVDKTNTGTVYNTNPYTQTYLSEDFVSTNSITDVLYVEDASKLVVTSIENVTTDSEGIVLLQNVARYMTAYPTLSIDNDFTFEFVGYNDIQITISDITTPTAVTITISQGNMLIVNSEFIQFTSIDLATNTVSGLLRGRKDTITNETLPAGTLVQSVLRRDKLLEAYYFQWWYNGESGWDNVDYPYDITEWDITPNETLAESTTDPAQFLQEQTPP